MQGNEKKDRMAYPQVKTIFTSKLWMMNKSLNDKYKNKESVFFNKMDHEVQNDEFVIRKLEIGV